MDSLGMLATAVLVGLVATAMEAAVLCLLQFVQWRLEERFSWGMDSEERFNSFLRDLVLMKLSASVLLMVAFVAFPEPLSWFGVALGCNAVFKWLLIIKRRESQLGWAVYGKLFKGGGYACA
ncbi:MAG: hypothetical protein WCO52_01710 [bacterium]